MRAYKTNSPLYLDYVASVYTRQQIMADPDLCLLLQNQYIKDNMEIALKWNAAKFGDYKDKVEFMEFFMCNGPQLDADTILHYRGLAYGDPACVEIAYSYFADGEKVMNIRQTKYGKKSGRDLWDCFKNPCFYMGRFSSTMGKSSDTENTASFWNVMASSFEKLFQSNEAKAQRKENEANKKGIQIKSVQQQKPATVPAVVPKVGGNTQIAPSETNPQQNPKPAISKSFTGWLLYGFTQGNAAWQKSIMDGDAEWLKDGIEKKGEDFKKWLSDTRIGDWYSNAIQGITQIATKANTKRHLGDCARLWKQLRTLKWFQESSNNVRPVSQSQIVGSTQTDGTATRPVQNSNPDASQITSGVRGNS